MKTGFRSYGAAVSLSRRRSLRRGTPGHDGIPRALGIMPLRHRYKPVGVTLGKKPGFFGSQAFCLYLYLSEDLLDSMVPPFIPRKATSVSRSHYFCGFSKHKWLLGGKGTGRKKASAKFDLHAKPRYSLIRKRDWRSGSALRSHRRGHWFEPSITHQ